MKDKLKCNKYLKSLKKFWNYIWYDDSFMSYVLNFVFAFLFIKFLFFPVIGFALNNDFPIVAIVSGSMEHKIVDNRVCDVYVKDIKNEKLSIDSWWEYCGNYYVKNYNLTLDDFEDYDYKNGLNVGDVMILYGKSPENIEVGEVLVFEPQNRVWYESHGPVIHRIVKKWQDEGGKYHFQTKGDHNPSSTQNFEGDISEDKVFAVAAVRIPFIGYAKLALNNVIMGIASIIR